MLFSTGCGYKFRANGVPVGIKIKSLAIPLVKSSSSERGFEADFTTVLRNEFISHAHIPLKNKDDASMILSGTIYEINTQPLTYNSVQRSIAGRLVIDETTSRRRLIIRMSMRLIDRLSGKAIWTDNSLEEEESYDVSTDPLVTRHNEREALLKIAKRLSERIYNKTMERF